MSPLRVWLLGRALRRITESKFVFCECGCGTLIDSKGSQGRRRRFVDGGHAKRGIPLKTEHREKIAEALVGHAVTADTRKAIAASKQGRPRSPETVKKVAAALSGANGSRWAGDGVGYTGAHIWLKKHFGFEMTKCEECEATVGLEWAYRGENGGWSRCREDYRILCRLHHRRFDLEKAAA